MTNAAAGPALFTALQINPDMSVKLLSWEPDGQTWRHLQDAIGGCFDVFPLTPAIDMWVHHEGLLLGLPVNRVATLLAAADPARALAGPIVGPVVLTGGPDANGATLPLPLSTVEDVRAFVADLLILSR